MPPERDAYGVLRVSRSASWSSIRAAYRALARRYHPDGSHPDTRLMAEINAAYECLEREHRRRRAAPPGVPVGPGKPRDEVQPSSHPNPAAERVGPLMRRVLATERPPTPVLDFGQYAGWQLSDVAAKDPTYLRWLSRHSSGVRFRAVIEGLLGASPDIGRRPSLLR